MEIQQSLYKSRDALRAPGSGGSENFKTFGNEGEKLSAVITGDLYPPQITPSSHFC